MDKKGIVNICVENLYPHPDNPRKNIGDVSELAESARKNGIMQNLTVIPLSALDTEPEEQPEAESISLLSDFHVLIGHRRLAAAKEAGLTEVPCKIISKISRREQVGIMLEENMQREDLTIYEQAQGFQMMLDLGETEDSIAEKTGFSKTTIRRRLNIAKLDQDVLKKKQEDDSFQLSLTDLYELEKVKSIEIRNEILNKASSSRDLARLSLNAVNEQIRKDNLALYVVSLKKLGIKQATQEMWRDFYSSKWERMADYDLNKEPPKRFKFEDNGEQIFYMERYGRLYLLRKAKKAKKVLTPQEEERKQKDRNKRQIKAILKEAANTRRIFIEGIISGKIEAIKDTKEIEAELFEQMLSWESFVGHNKLKEFFLGCEVYNAEKEDIKVAERKMESLSLLHKLLCITSAMVANADLVEWSFRYNKVSGKKVVKFYEILEKYGFSFPNEEEKSVVKGTSDLYVK